MRYAAVIGQTLVLMLLSGCGAMAPALFSAVDDIATDDAVSVNVYKSALQPNAEVKISVDITNKGKP